MSYNNNSKIKVPPAPVFCERISLKEYEREGVIYTSKELALLQQEHWNMAKKYNKKANESKIRFQYCSCTFLILLVSSVIAFLFTTRSNQEGFLLFNAISNAQFDVVKAILERNHSPLYINTQDSQGYSSLHYLCRDNHRIDKEFLDLLFQHEMNLDLQNNIGETALILCISNYNDGLASLMIDRGSSVTIQDDKGRNALDFYIERNLKDITGMDNNFLKKIIKGMNKDDVNHLNEDGFNHVSSIYQLRERRHTLEAIKILIEAGVDPNQAVHNNDRLTMLHQEVRINRDFYTFLKELPLLEYLISSEHVNVDTPSQNRKMTSLMEACHMDVVEKLIERGASVNTICTEGFSVLDYQLYTLFF